MATGTVGLQTHIWNNNLRSMFLLALYPVIMLGLTWAVAFAIGSLSISVHTGQDFAFDIVVSFWPIILTVVAIWFVVAYFFHTNMINKLSHAQPVTRKEEPELYNLLENLCIAEGMAMPRLNIIETHARNAFASGINDKTYAVTVTRGLMNSLKKDELEAVLAHELTHIINRDVRLLMVTVIFTGMIGFAAQMAWNSIRYNLRFGGASKNRGNGVIVVLAVAVILWIGYMATLFMRFALSRKREYMADAGAAALTKNPEAMMRALMRIAGRAQLPETSDDIAMMCIENKKPFMGMFATHPPIDRRIKALSQVTNTPVPDIKSLGPAQKSERLKPSEKLKNPWIMRHPGQHKAG